MSEKRALQLASVASMIDQFNIPNIEILQSLGYKVDVIADFTNPGTISNERAESLKSKLKVMGVRVIDISIPRSLSPNLLFNSYKKVKKIINNESYSLIHCHSPIGGAICRYAARDVRKNGTKVIYTAHGFHFYKGAPLKNWIIYYPIEKFLSRYTDIILTINKEDYNRALKKFYSDSVMYIPGVGVDVKNFSVCKVDKLDKRKKLGFQKSDFIFLSVIESSDPMNYIAMFDAFSIIANKQKIDNIVYLIVVGKEYEYDIKELINNYGLNKHVKFLCNRNDLDELCEVVDCFVYSGNSGNARKIDINYYEAMAAGLPVISIGEYIKGVINTSNINQLVSVIHKMKNNILFRNTCSSNNWKLSKSFNIINEENFITKIHNGGYSHLKTILIRQLKRAEIGISVNDFVIISVGELNKNKNHQVVIKAMQDVNGKYIIVGKGSNKEYLETLIKKMRVEKKVLLLGYRTDIKELLYMSDCFAFPSIREGLGLAALEAFSVGLPVVASNVGGIGDYLSNQTGMLCKTHCVEEYKEALNKIIDSSDMKTFYNNCITKASDFDIITVNTIMKNIYSSI